MHTPTDREIEALFWMANGKEPSEIAIIMGISSKRVNNIMYDVRSKLNAHTTSHAVAIGIKRGYITPDQIYDEDNCPDTQEWYKSVSKFLVVTLLIMCSAVHQDSQLRPRPTRRRKDGEFNLQVS